MKSNDDLVVVYETQGMLRAEIIKAKLESAGIPAMLKYESAGRTIGIIVDGFGKVQVLVRKQDAQTSSALLKEEK